VFASRRRAGIRVALDTGFSRDILNVLDRVGWREGDTFDISIASDEVHRGRPHPDLTHRAMARAGVLEPESVVNVGDTPADLVFELVMFFAGLRA
jgi:phosphoglycolate phosphatase-like HAD superfamily hydrolase